MNVTLYSTGCPVCTMLKMALDQAKIQYVINNDVDEMEKKGITSVPVLEVDGKMMNAGEAVRWLGEVTRE